MSVNDRLWYVVEKCVWTSKLTVASTWLKLEPCCCSDTKVVIVFRDTTLM